MKKDGRLKELEFDAEEKYSKQDPKPYMDNEDYLKHEADYEDNIIPHTGYWISKQVTQRGNISAEVGGNFLSLNKTF